MASPRTRDLVSRLTPWLVPATIILGWQAAADDIVDPAARTALADVLQRLAALAECVPEIAGVRLNPVLVSADGHAEITDVRIDLLPVPPDTRPPVRRL